VTRRDHKWNSNRFGQRLRNLIIGLSLVVIPVQGSADDGLKSEIAKWIDHNRAKGDLAQQCKPLHGYKNWESNELQDCTYRYKHTAAGGREVREARVLLILPETARIANWIVNACEDSGRGVTQPCVQATACRVKLQSGAQFPVAGIVTEDMEGSGSRKSYPFRDGVTVKIEGIPFATTERLTSQQIGLALDPALNSNLISTASSTGPARIQGTSRKDYHQSGGKEDTTGLKWLDIVRSSFQKALRSDKNELMTAWVKQRSTNDLVDLLNRAREKKLCIF
jgi:hypothetical protein